MKIILSQPAIEHPLLDAELAHWRKIVAPIEPILYKAQPGESHEELLIRMWRTCPRDTDIILLSELDFTPTETMVEEVQRRLEGKKALFAEHIRWLPGGFDHESRWPFIGGWFLAIRTEIIAQLPETWMYRNLRWKDDKSGNLKHAIHCDCGECAYIDMIKEQLVSPHEVEHVHAVSSWPTVRGVLYPLLGIHSFCSHQYCDSPDTVIWPTDSYTIGEHIDRLWKLIK